MTPVDWLLVTVVMFVGAGIQGGVGFGMNLIAAPILLLIDPRLVPGPAVLAAAVITDNLCNGLGTAAFVVFLTRLCDHRFSATQYALLTGISMLAGRLLAAASGVVIPLAGWSVISLVPPHEISGLKNHQGTKKREK